MPGLAGIGRVGDWVVDLHEPCAGEDCDYGVQLSRHPICVKVSLENFSDLRPLARAIGPGMDVEFSLDALGGKLHVVIFEGQLWIRMLVPCRDGSTQLFEVQFDAGEAKDLAAAIEEAVAEAEG